jgi:hypothetical protein
MFSAQDIVSLLFGSCFAACTAWFALLLQRVCKEINSALPPSEPKATLYPPLPSTVGQVFWEATIFGHSLQLLERHRLYYPASPIPKKLGLALTALLMSFVATIFTAR